MRFDPGTLLNPVNRILDVPDELIDQNIGAYNMSNTPTPCCVGAHLASLLGIDTGKGSDYMRGTDAWIDLIGGNRAHAILLLRLAGAGLYPLSSEPWVVPVKQVWQNLWKIEKLPVLSESNLCGIDLDHADMRNLKLKDKYPEVCSYYATNFRSASLYASNFAGANLRAANLKGANLEYTNFEGANLSDACLNGVTLGNTNFKNADMTRVTMQIDKHNFVNLGDTSFEGVTLQDSLLTHELRELIGYAE